MLERILVMIIDGVFLSLSASEGDSAGSFYRSVPSSLFLPDTVRRIA